MILCDFSDGVRKDGRVYVKFRDIGSAAGAKVSNQGKMPVLAAK